MRHCRELASSGRRPAGSKLRVTSRDVCALRTTQAPGMQRVPFCQGLASDRAHTSERAAHRHFLQGRAHLTMSQRSVARGTVLSLEGPPCLDT